MDTDAAPKPGDLCRILTDSSGNAYAVEHVAPCGQVGTVTDVRTGRTIR